MWVRLVLLLILVIINIPSWPMYTGTMMTPACAVKIQAEAEAEGSTEANNPPSPAVISPTKEQEDEHKGQRVGDHQQSSFQADVIVNNRMKSKDPVGINMNTDSIGAPIELVLNPSIQQDTGRKTDHSVSPPGHAPENGAPRKRSNTYYARLSAQPGTSEAKTQHDTVREALIALPGNVIIRQEFGADEDDVLNVISFRLEGNRDGLEEVAALDGVTGIYPVRTRKRPKDLSLGPLTWTRPSLDSAHVLTGVQMVHQKLGLTGKGIKVGIIDTGVDYKHPALGGCFGRGCKVAYGHDFVGDGYDNGDPENDTPKPDKDPMDCAGHGTHVAGIVAARNQGPNAKGSQEFVGVAPDGTLGAYRVFGCNGEVGDDVLLAALKAAYRDGMDVVNLSLGGSSGWPEEPFAMACSAYIRKGLHIAIANGNDGEEGLFEDGAPATASGAIAVGSVDNTHFLGPAADLFWQTIDQYGQGLSSKKVAVGRIGMAMGADAADAPLATFKSNMTYVVQVPTSNSMGCKAYTDADLEHKNQVPRANIIILLRRGECTYNDKAKFVAEAKLGGMFVYDTAPEQRPLSMSVTGYNISAAGLSFEDASLILDALKLKDIQASSGLKLTAQISKTDQVLKLASGGKISDFSSWGPDARLRYKPDIVTPGGMIYSTFPLAKGGFSTLQGTSMASPYMAGIQALYLSKYEKTDPFRLLNILQSTAVPTIKSGSNTGLTSIFQQGGGLVSMERLFAAEPPTVVFPTALYLNDTQFQKLDHDLTFHNPSASTTRIWTMVHRPAVSVNGFEDTNHYIPVNQSRLRTLEHGADSVIMSPSRLRLGPGQTGTIHIRIEVPGSLNVQERWLYSGFLEFHCQTDKGAACDSSLVSYGGMHGHLASIPILNPAWTYPALQLDRYANAKDVKTQGLHVNSAQETDTSISTKNNHDGNGTKHKDLYRNRSERVMVGKDEQDWVQLLVSINFPTGLLTIEVESVCDDDHGRSNGGDGKIRLEIGGPGRSRFEIETAEELQEVEHVISRVEQQGEQLDDMDPEEVALMKERLSRSQEMAFMPSGLYMPYEGYSKVMVRSSIVDEVMKLHRKKFHGAMDAEKTKHGHVGNKVGKPALGSKILKKNGGRRQGRGHCRKHGRRGRNKGHRRNTKKSPIPTRPSKSRTGATCVPRILGLIPNGFNPWSTRTGTAEGNTFQSYSWMGDLLLQNHNAHTTDQKSSFGSETMKRNKKGGRHRKHRRKGTEQDKACKRQSQTTETRGLPNGRYRLVVKVLKPWGVRGRVSDIERWSSPIIVIKRGK